MKKKQPLSIDELLSISEIPSKVKNLVLQYKKVFYEYMNDPGKYKGSIKHEINLKENFKIVKHTLRKYKLEQEKAMISILDDMIKDKQIESSKSRWVSPVVMVRKKTADWGKVVDYREVNNITKDET
uniref:Integrase catalytic domain-containing protein n=1 Tax=Strongyloides stercoralis TaxID=6248 RepID=A0A0K0EA92_STRER